MEDNDATFRNYLFFWSGQLVSLFGSSIAQFVIIWWITIETGSALYLSLAFFLGLAPMVILSPFAGVIVDRYSRRTLIGVVDLLQALVTVVIIFLLWIGTISLWLILLLLSLRGIFQAFHSPATAAVIPLMVPKEKLSRMNGVNYLFTGAVNLVGPVIAALLLEFWKIYEILWIDAGTFLVALIPLLMIKIPSVMRKQDRSPFRKDFMEGLAFVKKARGFLPMLILATVLNFLLTPLSTQLSYFVKFEHLGNASDLAFVMASLQGGILAGGIVMSVTKGFKKKMVAVLFSLYIIFLGYALVALTPTGLFLFMGASVLLLAICLPIANVSIMTIMQTVIPLEMQGRMSSVTMALASAAQPLGMILSGVIVELTRASYLFLGCALSGVLVLTLSWLFTDVRNVEKMEETPTQVPIARS